MIQTAIIGINGFGRAHLNDLLRAVQKNKCKLCAATIRHLDPLDPAVAQLQALGTEFFSDYRAMFQKYAGKLDLCCIPTGIASHLPLTLAALQAGCNVFVEKPVTPTWQMAQEMIKAEKQSGKFVAVGYQDLYQEKARRIKELLLSGQLGAPLLFKCYISWPRPQSYYNRNNWAGRIWGAQREPILDAPFTNAMGHFLNQINFYAGNSFTATPELKSLEAVLCRANPIQTCDTAAIKIQTADAKTLLFLGTHASAKNVSPQSVIECEKGCIRYDIKQVEIVDAQGQICDTWPQLESTQMRDAVFDALFERLRNPARFVCSVEIAASTVLIGNAVFDAAPIINVPEDDCEILTQNDSPLHTIKNINAVWERCFAENRLPNVQDYAFLPAATPQFSFANYAGFTGRQYC